MSTPYAPDPFDITQLLTLLPQQYCNQARWQGFSFDEKLENTTFYLPHVKEEYLPSLEAGLFELKLDGVPIPSLDASSVSDYATADEDSQEHESRHVATNFDNSEDVWTLPVVADGHRQPVLTSWDHFLAENHSEPSSAYLSQAGASVFDALVQTLSKTPARQLRPDKFLDALYELALGRSSVLFAWDAQMFAFIKKVESATVTGFTPEIIAKVVEDVSSTGTIINTLHRRQQRGSTSSSVNAFYATLRSCLAAIEAYMERQRPEIVSILSLQHIYGQPQVLLRILDSVRDTIQCSRSEADMLSRLLDDCRRLSLRYPQFTDTLNQILATIFAPVLTRIAAEIGLINFAESLNRTASPALHLFEASDLRQVANETHQTLNLLRAIAPGRAVALDRFNDHNALNLAFSWGAVNELQIAAIRYEAAAKVRLLRQPSGAIPRHPSADDQTPLQMEAFAGVPPVGYQETENGNLLRLDASSSELLPVDHLQHVVLACLQSDTASNSMLAVPLEEVLELSISPSLFAQHRLLSYSVLDLLFSEFHLQSHLHLLRQVPLLGDGVFATRLSMALFDDELASGEGQRRTGATTGLRLQTRASWPPASSELRLVLMGILNDSLSSGGNEGAGRIYLFCDQRLI